jgi:hypothetical protein
MKDYNLTLRNLRASHTLIYGSGERQGRGYNRDVCDSKIPTQTFSFFKESFLNHFD